MVINNYNLQQWVDFVIVVYMCIITLASNMEKQLWQETTCLHHCAHNSSLWCRITGVYITVSFDCKAAVWY